MGIPLVRLRAAVPEALIPGDLAHSVGRVHGLSAQAVAENSESYAQMLSTGKRPAIPKFPPELLEEPHAPAVDGTFASTALMFAFISIRRLLSEQVIEEERMRLADHFASLGMDDAAGSRFLELLCMLKAMLSRENLRRNAGWLNRARLWRLALLSSPVGSYEPSGGLAFSLYATSENDDWSQDPRADCPLSFSSAAILQSVPGELEHKLHPEASVARVWASALAAAVQETLDAGLSSAYTETALNRTRAYVEAQCSCDDDFGEGFAVVMDLAQNQISQWAQAQRQRVHVLRDAQLSTRAHGMLLANRAAARLVQALVIGHGSLSVFFLTLNSRIRRWQSIVVVITTLVALLVVNVWCVLSPSRHAPSSLTRRARRFGYQRALACCRDYRTFLGCDPDYRQPCRGSNADCADLQSLFSGVVNIGVDADASVCHAFPDNNNRRDALVMGLIAFTCSVPVTFVIATTLACANSNEHRCFLFRSAGVAATCLCWAVFSWVRFFALCCRGQRRSSTAH
jgi:hypothetical protein